VSIQHNERTKILRACLHCAYAHGSVVFLRHKKRVEKGPFRWLQGGCIGHMILVFRKGSAGSNQPGKRSRNKEVYRYKEVEVFMNTYYVRVTRKILAASIPQPAFVLAAETLATAHPKEPDGETPSTLQLFPLTCQLFAIHIIQPSIFIRTISP
jgi:hypothetical protein